MKKYLLIAVAALLLVSVPRVAQAQKAAPTAVAHLNLDSLLDIMPAFKAASDSAQMFYAELERTLYAMDLEFRRKKNEYDSLYKTWSEPIRGLREKELYDQQQNMQLFQQQAEQSYAARRTQLLIPIFDKIQAAVKAVALERGYTYVLDSSKSANVVLYAGTGADIFDAVRVRLGIPVPPKTPAPGGAPVPPGGR